MRLVARAIAPDAWRHGRVYLETSSLNKLADDPYLSDVLPYLLRSTRLSFLVSNTVLQQATHCRDHDRIRHLLAVMSGFGERLRVFEDPRDVLRKSAAALGRGKHYDPHIGTDKPTRWLREVNTGRYSLLASDVSSGAELYRRQAEDWVTTYAESRLSIQASPAAAHERTMAALIRAAVSDAALLDGFAHEVANIGRKRAARVKAGNILRDSKWQAYLPTLGLSAHRAMAAKTDYNPKRLPDPADIMQSVFLPTVDIFLVDDRRFARALRGARRIARIRSQVSTYADLSQRCVLAMT
jgi:hypothetical protein